jgi:MYXO-CTERM domain-containing protein
VSMCLNFGMRASLAAIALGLTTTSSIAGTIGVPEMQIWMQVNDNDMIPYTPAGFQNPDGTYTYNGYYEGSGFDLDFDAIADIDPFINNTVAVTNTSGSTNTYTFIVMLPTIAITGGTVMGASIGGSVTDANFDGSATLGSAGEPIFTGLIDGSAAPGATLLNDPYASPAVPFAGGTSNILATSFGLPGPSFPGPDLLGSIGIQLKFTLTPGDTAAITSFFIVEPVPAPAALALLGLAGLAGSRRRRS